MSSTKSRANQTASPPWIKEIEALLSFRRYDQALMCVMSVINKEYQNPLAHYYSGLCLKLSGEFEGAIGAFSESLSISNEEDMPPDDIHGHLHECWHQIQDDKISALANLAVFYDQQQDESRALKYENEAIALNPNHPDSIILLGARLLNSGAFKEAIHTLDRVLEIHPNSSNALIMKARAYVAMYDYEPAKQICNRLTRLKDDPNSLLATGLLQSIGIFETLLRTTHKRNLTICPECHSESYVMAKHCSICGLVVEREGRLLIPKIDIVRNAIFGYTSVTSFYIRDEGTYYSVETFQNDCPYLKPNWDGLKNDIQENYDRYCQWKKSRK